MILLVFEGKTREPRIYKTVRELFFKDVVLDDIFVSYCSHIYSLYQQMKTFIHIQRIYLVERCERKKGALYLRRH